MKFKANINWDVMQSCKVSEPTRMGHVRSALWTDAESLQIEGCSGALKTANDYLLMELTKYGRKRNFKNLRSLYEEELSALEQEKFPISQ